MNNTVRYAAGDWFLVARERGFALLPNTVPVSLLETVWETLDSGGGLASVIDKLTGAYGMSLSAIPPFAMAINEQDDLRVAVRGGVRVAYDDGTRQDLITGGRVQTWVEQAIPPYATIVVTPPDARIEETMLPIASGVVRTGLVTIGSPDQVRAEDAAEPRRRRRRKTEAADGAEEHEDGLEDDVVDEEAAAEQPEEAFAPDPREAADENLAAAASEHVTAAAAPIVAATEPEQDEDAQASADAPEDVTASDEPAAEEDASDESAAADEPVTDEADADAQASDAPAAQAADEGAGAEADRAEEPAEGVDGGEAASDEAPSEEASSDESESEESPAAEDDAQGDAAAPDEAPADDANVAADADAGAHTDGADEAEADAQPAELSDDAVDQQFAEIRERQLADEQPVGDHDGHTLEHASVRSMREEGNEAGSPSAQVSTPAVFSGRAVLSTGRVLTLDRVLVVGRRPRVTRTSTGAVPALVAVESPTHDISRNHIEIRRDGESVLVTDLNTTNGTVLLREGEDPRRLHPGEAMLVVSGDVVDIGDEVTVTFEEIH